MPIQRTIPKPVLTNHFWHQAQQPQSSSIKSTDMRFFKGSWNPPDIKTLLTLFLPNYVNETQFKKQRYQSIKAQSVLHENKPHNNSIHMGIVCAQYLMYYLSPPWAVLYLQSIVESLLFQSSIPQSVCSLILPCVYRSLSMAGYSSCYKVETEVRENGRRINRSGKETTKCLRFMRFISSHYRLKPLISGEQMKSNLQQQTAAILCDNGQLVQNNLPIT